MAENNKPASATPTSGSSWPLTVALALIGVSAPIATGVYEYMAKQREVAVTERENAFKRESWFLQTAVDPSKTPELRQQVLRYIKGDSNLVAWATDELKRVDEQVEDKRKVVELTEKLRSAQEAVVARTAELEKVKTLAGFQAKEIASRRAALDKATAEAVEAKREVEASRKALADKWIDQRFQGPFIDTQTGRPFAPGNDGLWVDEMAT
jgi:hypothetical protein